MEPLRQSISSISIAEGTGPHLNNWFKFVTVLPTEKANEVIDRIRESTNNNDEFFQEICRVVDASLSVLYPENLCTGQNGLKVIREASTFFRLDNIQLSPEFDEVVKDVVRNTIIEDETTNVRGPVKKVYMYPKYTFDPWVEHQLTEQLEQQVSETVSNFDFKLSLTDGKVYALTSNTEGKTLTEKVFELVGGEVDMVGCKPNAETTHLTIINSDVVAKIGQDKVQTFLDNYSTTFTVNFNGIKSTLSRDWPVFSQCYVLSLKAEYISTFVDKFNEQFELTKVPSIHLTFASKPRSVI